MRVWVLSRQSRSGDCTMISVSISKKRAMAIAAEQVDFDLQWRQIEGDAFLANAYNDSVYPDRDVFIVETVRVS